MITFDKHPNTVVAPHAVPKSIYSIEQNLRAIQELGVDTTLVIHFDEAFSRLNAGEFINRLISDFGRIRSVCVGREFTFGYRRGGNVDLLRRFGEEFDFNVHGLAAVSLDDQVVSSTRIRQAICEGELDFAGQMLGRDYKLSGTVVRGDGIGRTLGFPTANIDVTGVQTPPDGVYAVHVFRGGEIMRGVANIGVRPTVDQKAGELRLEVHIMDFDDDLYNELVEIQFLDFIRTEMKFSSLEELRTQIARDIEAAKSKF